MAFSKIIGIISDTHGLVRPEAIEVLQDSDLLIHAGDIGSPDVLEALRSIAPVYAVRGNNDREEWAQNIPLTEQISFCDHILYVIHEIAQLDLDSHVADFSAVIYGHSHKPVAEKRDGVLYLNPGSAGRKRFKLPVTVARLYVCEDGLEHEIIGLAV